jgi:hypothetical protein
MGLPNLAFKIEKTDSLVGPLNLKNSEKCAAIDTT